MNEANTHCQICERQVKTRNGVTSHHGYTRPGNGWQTGSCPGARELPYEVSCALIPPVIKSIESYRDGLEEKITAYKTTPPENLVKKTYSSWTQNTTTETFDRPEGFNVEDCLAGKFRYDDNYNKEFEKAIYMMTRDIKGANDDITRLQRRVDNWKKVL